jgi:hypothetical protein
MQDRRHTDQEGVILPSVQIPTFPVECIRHMALRVAREVREQLVNQVSRLTTYEHPCAGPGP